MSDSAPNFGRAVLAGTGPFGSFVAVLELKVIVAEGTGLDCEGTTVRG